jgi:intracellular multiplication protein IcmK
MNRLRLLTVLGLLALPAASALAQNVVPGGGSPPGPAASEANAISSLRRSATPGGTAVTAPVATNDIQPVDNQAIANTMATAAQPAGQITAGEAAQDATRRATFDSALAGTLPLKPEEIRAMLERLSESQAAVATPVVAPEAEIKAETISLEPGAQPPEIETETGYVTTLSLLDATGNPWPILDIGVGGNFDVPAPEQGGNVLRITPLTKFAVGNISIRLVNLTTPLSFKLRASSGKVYYRYDARIPKFGPQAAAPLIDRGNALEAGDALLMNFLDGGAPLDATRLTVTGVDQRTAAWRYGGRLYVRTPLQLLSPGWDGSVGSGDTHVYVLADTPVLLMSDNGIMVHARIGNNAKTDEQPVPAINDSRVRAQTVSATSRTTASPLITQGTDAILPTPAGSRTLIRPVPVAAAQTTGASGTAANGTNPATGVFGAPAKGSVPASQTTAPTAGGQPSAQGNQQ